MHTKCGSDTTNSGYRFPSECSIRNHPPVLVPSNNRYAQSRLPRSSSNELHRLVSALAFRMEYTQAPEELLSAVVELIAGEMHLPYVRIDIEHGSWGEGSAASGEPVGTPLSLPLTYQGYPAGQLIVTGGRAGRALPRRQRRALLEVARHAGAALHTARL
ncbi:MAG: hypothetical protein JWR06_2140, partial [Jatrophihabitans sp.]|nr:hypothetical protein [Jatrophihabitans sp.]